MDQKEKLNVFRELTAVVEDIVNATPEGVPAGLMYMAFQEKLGLSYNQFQALMSALVTAGKIRHSNHQYFPIKK